MSPSEELKAAAERIRKLADEASPGPWCRDYAYAAIRHVQRNCDLYVECGQHGSDDDCKSFGMYDGPYVAMWDPPTALIVADLLDGAAVAWDNNAGALDEEDFTDLYEPALRLARHINGGPS